jgi:Ser/Thr protein kinase RdoA (MazF antagonist)
MTADFSQTPPRTAELVLVTPDGAVVGRLPPVAVATPWWQEAWPVVQAVREHYGIDATILRLLATERDRPHGGRVTYLAEVAQPVAAEPWAGTLDDHPLRPSYAQLGGPAADLAWAQRILAGHGLRPVAPPVQIRSWNLSSLWRIPVEGQEVWLKAVPAFFAHEGRLLARMQDRQVPRLLGHGDGRVLLAEIPGEDLYEATLPQLLGMVTLLVDLQRSWQGRVEELLALGLADWRAPALVPAIASVVERTADELDVADRAILAGFLDGLPQRFADIAACGLDDTLVHGDFHPGNVRGNGEALTLLDWGDSGVGHPLLDQPAFLDRIPDDALVPVRARWLQRWREIAPGADPERAARLLAPVAAARQAVIYQRFLDNIEPAERVHHRADPADWLHRTALILGGFESAAYTEV